MSIDILHCLALKQPPFPAGLALSGPATFFSPLQPLCSFPQSLSIFSSGLEDGSPLGNMGRKACFHFWCLLKVPWGFWTQVRKTLLVYLSHFVISFQWDKELKEMSYFHQGWEGMSKEKEGKKNVMSVRKHHLLCKILG